MIPTQLLERKQSTSWREMNSPGRIPPRSPDRSPKYLPRSAHHAEGRLDHAWSAWDRWPSVFFRAELLRQRRHQASVFDLNLADDVRGWRSRDSMTQPVPSIATCFAGSTRTAKMASVGALMVMLTLTVSLATATTSCLMGLEPNTNVRRSPNLKFIVRHRRQDDCIPGDPVDCSRVRIEVPIAHYQLFRPRD